MDFTDNPPKTDNFVMRRHQIIEAHHGFFCVFQIYVECYSHILPMRVTSEKP